MKEEILSLFKAQKGIYISGEEISNHLQVSRTAIWKHIKALKEEGYVFESQSRLGYKLIKIPDNLYPREIFPLTKTQFIGQEIKYFEEVTSTNEIAKEIAEASAEGTIVLAEEQTKGKGRLGRAWTSPKGSGIWVSVILKPNLNPIEAPRLTPMVALALAKAIKEETSLMVGIKWPNDVVYKGKKLAGILTEMNAEIDKINYIILGVGINVNIDQEEFPQDLKEKATSLKIELGNIVSRKELLASFLKWLEEYYKIMLAGNYDQIMAEIKRHSTTLGAMVRVSGIKESWEGLVEDIDSEGALLLRLKDGSLKKIIAGDVSIRTDKGTYSDF